jgi:hypothetical protein
MTQIMVEFGSNSLGPVRGATESALADVAYTIQALRTENTRGLEYRPVDGDLEEVYADLISGALSSIRFKSDGADVAWALLYGPGFARDRPRPWTGVVELRHPGYQPLFEQLVGRGDLDFVVVSQEETLDLAPGSITPPRFPWDDWRLIKAALPSGPGLKREWVIRPGPARVTK